MTDPAVSPPPRPTKLDRISMALATGLGTGYAPKAPGTVGSLLGPVLIWSLGTDGTRPGWTLFCGVLTFLVGVLVSNVSIRLLDSKDPQQVVIDEIAAFFWVFLLVPITPVTAVSGFLLFRVFDILKPWPIRRLEHLPKGLGIMSDDALAGMIAGGILAILWNLLHTTRELPLPESFVLDFIVERIVS